MKILSPILKGIEDYLFPSLCLICDHECAPGSKWLCKECLRKLLSNNQKRNACPRCGQNKEYRDCTCEISWDMSFERVISAFDYDEIVQMLIREIKYSGKSKLAFYMGVLTQALINPANFSHIDYFIPIPLHPFRKLKRGYNQAEVFTHGFLNNHEFIKRIKVDLIKRNRSTKTQTKLDKDERLKNLSNAFSINPKMKSSIVNKRFLVVDDVVTTTATVGQCAKLLKQEGALSVDVLSIARD